VSKFRTRTGQTWFFSIPPVAQIGIPPALIEKLRTRYGKSITGIKDSSGDWENDDDYWRYVRPPLSPLPGLDSQALLRELEEMEFRSPKF
jgi:dihydrodipicolinate synthase/N-acetylneuraminate lyase